MGTASWGWAVTKACRQLRERIDSSVRRMPRPGLEATADTKEDVAAMEPYSRTRLRSPVRARCGSTAAPARCGCHGWSACSPPAGSSIARTARSQLIGGMTMGLSMALHEEGVMDVAFGDYANHDLASYHVAANADVGDIDVELAGRGRPAPERHRDQGDRRDRDRRDRGGDGQRRPSRHGCPGAQGADTSGGPAHRPLTPLGCRRRVPGTTLCRITARQRHQRTDRRAPGRGLDADQRHTAHQGRRRDHGYPQASIRDLVCLLAEHNVGALVVSHDGKAVEGIVSERDIVRRLQSDPGVLDATVDPS